MIALKHASLHRADIETRMPFRYGIATMTGLPHVFLHTEWEIDGRTATGLASENLPPKWFTKDADADPLDEITTMVGVIREAMRIASGLSPAVDPFSFWLALNGRMSAWGESAGLAPLLTGLGTSLVERSMLDAFCRLHRTPLARALQRGLAGLRLGAVHPELEATAVSDWLPSDPLAEVEVRHTVGLSDPLTETDLAPESRCHDGLPQTLEESVRAYGLRAFKLKLSGDSSGDEARLEAIFSVLDKCASRDWVFSLDGNENFHSAEAFRARWEALCGHAWFRGRLHRLLFVEQPVRRAEALCPDADWTPWREAPAVIIDESDGEPSSLRTALDLGYSGVSHKNCKGVFRGIANACLLRKRSTGGRPLVMSGEDLANIGPVALQQDLAVQAFLGNASVERNGHHYFRGLSAWPDGWQKAVLESHSDLYRTHSEGWPTLRVEAGRISLRSVNTAPFGTVPLLAAHEVFPAIA